MASFTAAYKLPFIRPSLTSSSPQHLLPSLNKSVLSFSSTPSFSSISLASTGNHRCGSLVASAAAGPKWLLGSLTSTQGLKFVCKLYAGSDYLTAWHLTLLLYMQVVARFNEIVTSLLLKGALETFRRYSIKEEDITVVSVPGSFEIPVVAQKLGKTGAYDAIICIGLRSEEIQPTMMLLPTQRHLGYCQRVYLQGCLAFLEFSLVMTWIRH